MEERDLHKQDAVCQLTGGEVKEENEELYRGSQEDNALRKIYAAKTYKFIYPSESCPYRVGYDCELRKVNVYETSKHYYSDTCCKSRYHKRCRHFADKVSTIKENRYFKASYCCPYLVEGVCILRNVNMRGQNRAFYDSTCCKTEYIRRCPHFHEAVGRIKKRPQVISGKDCCPHLDKGRCRVRENDVKKRCRDFHDHTCCKKKYHKCCPHYARVDVD